MDIVPGIDVSVVQTVTSWQAVRDEGYRWVVAKATEGERYVDPKMVSHINGANSVGMLTGAYAFALPDEDAEDDVRGFMEAIKPLQDKYALDFPATLDIETRNSRSPKTILTWCRKWSDLYVQKDVMNRRPFIYTSYGFWEGLVKEEPTLALDPFWKDHVLWVAHYTSAPKPLIPRPWSGLWTPGGARMWQWAASDPAGPLGRVKGIQGLVDLNRFGGFYDDLRVLAGLQVALPLPETSYRSSGGK